MSKPPSIVLPITKKYDPLGLEARQLSRLACGLKKRLVRHERLGPRVDELACELFGRVSRVRGACDATGPEDAEVYDSRVDVVRGEES